MKTTISLYITLVLGLLFTIIWSCTDDTDVLEGESSFVKGTVPVISLTNMTSIGYTDASVEVKVENTGARKVSRLALCYNTTGTEPCKDDQILELGEVNVNNNNTTHLANLTNLTHNTTYYIRAYAVNSEGESYSDSIRFSTKLDIRLPQVTTEATSGLGKTGATLYGEVTNIGQSNITQYGFVYATHNNPTFEDFKTQKGELTNTAKFTDGLIGLESSTLYYYRAYATNSFGTSFGVLASFITYGIPQVSTTDITEITYTTAKAGCNVTFNGGQSITAYGIVWSTKQNPDLSTNEGILKINSYIENQLFRIIDLAQGTTYYVRAFATNSNGTAYGEQKSFTTISGNLAEVITGQINNITYYSANIGGEVTSDGGNFVINRGIVWDTLSDPTKNKCMNYSEDGNGIGKFSSHIYLKMTIPDDKKYFVRTYAQTTVGTSYGSQVEFTPKIRPWIKKTNFSGTERLHKVGFSIGNKGYIGTGSCNTGKLKDFWEYNPETNSWSQKADFGGTARYGAVGFSINNKGYIGTGYMTGAGHLKDFWEYNPETNNWTQKADLGGYARMHAVGFSIGNKGYIGTGYNYSEGDLKDFWEYNPETNNWTQKADFGGNARENAVGFSINQKGYIGTGWITNSTTRLRDLWEYNPASNNWHQKADFGGEPRIMAVGFSINNIGIIGLGSGKYHLYDDIWMYDPVKDSWNRQRFSFLEKRNDAVGFAIGSKGYIGTGQSNGYLNDFWEYDPQNE